MNVVVVESPAKAKTINKFLGSDFRVLASYGHVRDLPPKDGSVRPEEDFSLIWQTDPKSKKHLDEIANALNGSGNLYLATDPDREGEAISWHVQQLLADRDVLDGVDVKRVVFHEITKDAVLAAMANPRELNRELVDAYLALGLGPARLTFFIENLTDTAYASWSDVFYLGQTDPGFIYSNQVMLGAPRTFSLLLQTRF